MHMIRNTEWSDEQAYRVAELMVDPKTNGGLSMQDMLPVLLPDEVVKATLAHLVKAYQQPMYLLEDGEKQLQISADPYDPNGQSYLHFSARDYTAKEVLPHLGEFMAQHPAEQWVAIGTRPGMYRLICKPLGFTLIQQLKDAFWATKNTKEMN